MQEVFPPKRLVPGPGAAIDPRVPQKRSLIDSPSRTVYRGLDGDLRQSLACARGSEWSFRAGRVGEDQKVPLPSSNRRCRFPTSGSRESSRLRHAQLPIDGLAPASPDVVAKVPLAEDDMAAGSAAADAGSDGPEHSVRSHSKR